MNCKMKMQQIDLNLKQITNPNSQKRKHKKEINLNN